jgi:anti-anti-sigma factor
MLSIDTQGSALVLRVKGDVNVVDVVALRNAISIAMEEAACQQVVVDMRDAHRLGPRGMALLVDEKTILMRRGGDLLLVVGDEIEPGLERLFCLHATVEEAVASLQ